MEVCTAGSDSPAPRLRGLAVTWGRDAVYYVKLTMEGGPQVWKLCAAILETAGTTKITYDLKHQLAAILPSGEASARCSCA